MSIRWLRVRPPSPSLEVSGRKSRTCGHCCILGNAEVGSSRGQSGDDPCAAVRIRPMGPRHADVLIAFSLMAPDLTSRNGLPFLMPTVP